MIPEGPRVYESPNGGLTAYRSTYRSKTPQEVNCSGKIVRTGLGDPYIELKFRLDLALDHDGKRPPRSVLVEILKQGIPDYLDFLSQLQTHPQLKGVPLIYGSSNTVMSMAANRHCGFHIQKIEDPERDKMLEEDPAMASHILYASPEELIARTDHIRSLIQRVSRW